MSALDTPTPFRFRCPKCGYANHFTVTRTGPSYAQSRGDQWHDKVLACLCGKRLYGQQIVDEYDRQKAEHEGRLEEARKEAAAAKRKAAAAKRRAEAEARAKLQAAEEERNRAKMCAFPECSNTARDRSMYCSRECSNRNARARYAARKKALSRS
jgi:hypothetical protein